LNKEESKMYNSWIDWAVRAGIESEILAYLSIKKDDFFNFSATSPYPTPRSWVAADQWLKMYKKGKMNYEELRKALAGTVGPEVAEKFTTFIMIGNLRVPVDVKKAKEELFIELENIPNEVPVMSYHPEMKAYSLVFLIAAGYRPDLLWTFKRYEDGYKVDNIVFHQHEILHFTLVMSLEAMISVKEWLINCGCSENEATEIVCYQLNTLFDWINKQYNEVIEKRGKVGVQVILDAIRVLIIERYYKVLGCKI